MCKVPNKIDSIDCGNTNKINTKKEIKSIDYIFEVYYVNLKQETKKKKIFNKQKKIQK